MSCRRDASEDVYRACVTECLAIYSEDGVQDTETLGHIELLDCSEVVGFVEGDSGRPPGGLQPPRASPN